MIAYPARGHEVRARIVAGAAPYHHQAGRPAAFARRLTDPLQRRDAAGNEGAGNAAAPPSSLPPR